MKLLFNVVLKENKCKYKCVVEKLQASDESQVESQEENQKKHFHAFSRVGLLLNLQRNSQIRINHLRLCERESYPHAKMPCLIFTRSHLRFVGTRSWGALSPLVELLFQPTSPIPVLDSAPFPYTPSFLLPKKQGMFFFNRYFCLPYQRLVESSEVRRHITAFLSSGVYFLECLKLPSSLEESSSAANIFCKEHEQVSNSQSSNPKAKLFATL